VSREELFDILRHSRLRARLLGGIGFEDDEEEQPRTVRRRRSPAVKEPVPNPNGQDLMWSGSFGLSERRVNRIAKHSRVSRRLLEREMGGHSYGLDKAQTSLMKQVSSRR
jgi:hypothetical protein